MNVSLAEMMGRTSAEPYEVVADGQVHLTQQGIVDFMLDDALEPLGGVDANLKKDFSLAMVAADFYDADPAHVAEIFSEERQQFLSDELLAAGMRAFYMAQQFMRETPPDGMY